MAAKAILAPKHNSFQFEDRLLELSSPVRIGRSHKEDKADSGNGFFDCKVLSRNHATLVFDEGKFYVVDTGSSNGTFVNNIRLSKCGEESKVTELFTGDTLRFGSDVVDKAKSVTQKCVVAKLRLIYNDGTECDTRPVSSRLFRPSSSEPEPVNKNGTNGVHHRESGDAEKMEMARRLAEIEAKLADRDQFCSSVAIKQERDATEITKLRLLVDSQNNDIANLEAALSDTQTELDRGDQAEETRRRYEVQMKELETFYNSEEAKLRQELEEAAVTQSELLDKIKTLESESGYAQAEVEKVVIRENCEFEYKQELEYKIECLTTELQHCRVQLQQAEANKVVARSEEDIKVIDEQAEQLVKLKGEVSYYKQELIDARSRKAAAEDELNTVKGTVETINNSSTALSTEIEGLNETIKMLNKKLEEETARASHLDSLVAAMEAEPGVEAKSKVEISDLKTELASSQAELKAKMEEILVIKDRVRQEQEVVQQRDIEISSLRGKLQFSEEELELVKTQSGDISGLEAEINSLRNKLNYEMGELEVSRSDNTKLSSELQQQQVLYNELKKMRGRGGEELELLEAAQRDVVEARDAASQYKAGLEHLKAENSELLAEIATLKTVKSVIHEPVMTQSPETVSVETKEDVIEEAARSSPLLKRTMAAGEAVMANVGTLKLYEILLGLVFISVIISWNPYV